MAPGKRPSWKLAVAALLTGAILASGVVLQLFYGLLATFDVIEPGQALARFWGSLVIGYALCSAVLLGLFIPGARLAARSGGYSRFFLTGGVLGLVTQFVAFQAALLWHASSRESGIPVVVMVLVVIAVPLALFAVEFFLVRQVRVASATR